MFFLKKKKKDVAVPVNNFTTNIQEEDSYTKPPAPVMDDSYTKPPALAIDDEASLQGYAAPNETFVL